MTERWTRFAGSEGATEVRALAPATVVVLADLTGASGDRSGAAMRVDRDDLDDLLAQLAPRLDMPAVGEIGLSDWSCFGPDGLVSHSRALAALLRAREAAGDRRSLARLLAEAGVAGLKEAAPEWGRGSASPPSSADGAALLEELLGGERASTPAQVRSRDPWLERVVREIADSAPSSRRDDEASRIRAAIDTEISRRVRLALAHPSFAALESSWRSLRSLMLAVETSEDLRVRVVDVAREGLGAAALALSTAFPDGERAALLVACFAFDASDADGAALWQLARAASALGATALADAGPALLERAASGALTRDAAWCALRDEVGAHLRLVGPRVLARPPYGASGTPVESFAFDDGGEPSACWQSAAALVARAVISGECEIDGLPLFVVRRAGQPVQVGPAECVFSAREVERLLEVGLIVVAAAGGTDSVRVLGWL